MTKSVESSETTSAFALQLAPPPVTNPLSVASDLQQISNASSQTAHLLQQQYDLHQALSGQQHHSVPEAYPFSETSAFRSAIRNTIQPSVWEQRDNPLPAPVLQYLPESHYSVACNPLNLTFAQPCDTDNWDSLQQQPRSLQDYCISAEKKVSQALGSRLERVVQKLAAHAGRAEPPQMPAADIRGRAQPAQTPATSASKPGQPRPAKATSASRVRQSASPPETGAGTRAQILSTPATGFSRTEEWVQQTVVREQEQRNATNAVMKDAASILKRMVKPPEEIPQALSDILKKMAAAMPELIKSQFEVAAKKYTSPQFPSGMQHTAVGVLTRVITFQARAQVNPKSAEARQLQKMSALDDKITQLQQSLAPNSAEVTSVAMQQRIGRRLNKIQGQYHQCLAEMFPQYTLLNTLSGAESSEQIDEVISYCINACSAAAQSQQPIPSHESSTLSQISVLSPSHQDTRSRSVGPASPMEILTPPQLSPARSLSEYSKFSFPPALNVALRNAEVQTDEMPPDEAVFEDVHNVEIQTDDVRSDGIPIVEMRHAEVQTSDILSWEIHSTGVSSPATPSPAARKILINLDRQTSDSSQTIASPMDVSPPRRSLRSPQRHARSAAEQTFGTALLMWDTLAQRLQAFDDNVREERLQALADWLTLPQQHWRQLADSHGLTLQGRTMLDAWQNKQEITEAEKTENLLRFDYYLTQPKKGWQGAFSPSRETTLSATSSLPATPQPELITIAGAPNLSWLANNLDDPDA